MSEFLGPYLDHLRSVRRSANTVKHRGAFLRRIDAQLPCGLDAALSEELHAVVYRPDYAPWTLATYYAHLGGFFAWACSTRCSLDEILDLNPMDDVERPRTPDCLPNPVSDTQLAGILDTLTGPLRDAVVLAAYAGLRSVEIARCDREHITRDNIVIPVGKGDRPGVVPTHPVIWDMVKDRPRGPVVRDAGQRWDEHRLSTQAAYYLRQLLGEQCGLHRMRHWYGTTVYRTTRDPVRTQQLLRHRNPRSTLGYILIANEERAEAIGALPVLTPAGR